jgi:heat shock protein HtpX
MRTQRDLFPTDYGLVARMAVTAVFTPLVVVAGLGAVIEFAPTKVVLMVFAALIVGAAVAVHEAVEASQRGLPLSPADAPELHATVERLCVVADLAKPALMLEREAQPNSWVEGTRRGGYRLHLTQGLLNLLDPRELEAVVGHELAHVAHRDAAVMTVVGGPGEALLGGGLRVAGQGWWPLMLGGYVAAAIGWASTIGTRMLSRYREFAADAGAVQLTGNPVALASALMKVSEGLVAIPQKDLRSAAVRDAFHLLPTARGKDGLLDTHPSLQARVERLQRLERTLQQS